MLGETRLITRPVMVRFERSSLAETEVLGLVVPQFGEVGTKPRQMDTGSVLVCQTGARSSFTHTHTHTHTQRRTTGYIRSHG